MAQSGEHTPLDLRVVSVSPILGGEITLKKRESQKEKKEEKKKQPSYPAGKSKWRCHMELKNPGNTRKRREALPSQLPDEVLKQLQPQPPSTAPVQEKPSKISRRTALLSQIYTQSYGS